MKILAVCRFGVGSSMVLKMTIDKAVKRLGIDADVENTDVSTAKSSKCDAIFTSYDVAESLKETVKVPVLPVKRYMNIEEVTEQLKKII
jgi:PTS system ascorbate-specific IIB component